MRCRSCVHFDPVIEKGWIRIDDYTKKKVEDDVAGKCKETGFELYIWERNEKCEIFYSKKQKEEDRIALKSW